MSGKHFLCALVSAAVAVLSVTAAGVSAPPPTFGTGPSTAVEMRQHILDSLTGKATGFAYAIVKDGQLVVGEGVGKARTGPDGNRNMTRSSRLNVMSVTKTTTAVAILQLLDELNLSIHSKIEPWLPSEWTKGLGFWGANGLSFRHLLTHTSGLGQYFDQLKAMNPESAESWGNDWDGLEFVVSNGAAPGSAYSYKNANYALLRIMIPALWKATGNHPGINVINEVNVGIWYLAYVQQRVFGPAGASGVTCAESNDATAALVYNASNTAAGGKLVETNPPNLDGCGGHANLHLSALDLAKFMAHLTHGTLLSPGQRFLMDGFRLGWNKSSNTQGKVGIYWHGGDGKWTNGGVKREVHACVMKFPGDIQATLVVNSNITSGTYQCTVLLNAYKQAIA
jgi:CubicO group peptidase (beta-lactamase class C family)